MPKPTIAGLQAANAKLLTEVKLLRKKEANQESNPNQTPQDVISFGGQAAGPKPDTVYSAVVDCHEMVTHIQQHNARIQKSVSCISGNQKEDTDKGAPSRSGTLGMLQDLRDRLNILNSSINENASNLEAVLG